ncbi:MAG: LLM class flavin-dependent oxidoreductase, partial [Actinomycetota bacterium]
MTPSTPAVSLVATPTKRQAMIDLAVEIERRGFSGIACPSLGATMSLCTSLAHATTTIPFWTSIQPIYYNHPVELGNTAAHIHEIPGGVQAQVLGLAREMRRLGHEVRVLAPCDGPPPEPFVTPPGNSLPASANGSVAPLAPDPSAALRTIRALNDEAFDVIHLHEPLVPGPTVTALLLRLAPTVGTFHSAGESGAYRMLSKTARWGADHLSTRVAVSEAARELAHRYLGGGPSHGASTR